MESYWTKNVAALMDVGIHFEDSLQESICYSKDYDKILLIYIQNKLNASDCFMDILLNNDINYLFKNDFVIYASDIADTECLSNLGNLIDTSTVKPNTIYTITFNKENDNKSGKVSVINCNDTQKEEILYELYMIHEKFVHAIRAENDRIVDNCGKLSMDELCWLNSIVSEKYLPIKQAINESINQASPHLRKVLMLYMSHDTSELTIFLNTYFDSCFNRKYDKLCVPIVWNITNPFFHKYLQNACDYYFNHDILKETITGSDGGLFFFVSDEISSVPKIFFAVTSNTHSMESLHETLDAFFQDFICYNRITVISELSAINAFKKNLSGMEKYALNYFETGSLHEITEMCLQIPRKMLLLHFGTSCDYLRRCLFNNGKLIISNKVSLIAWNITENAIKPHLLQALRCTFNIKKLEEILSANKSALFIFVPMGRTLILHSALDSSATQKSFLKAYNAANEFFLLESALGDDLENITGPADYQQIMCDQMSNRDFDCFKLNENEGEHLERKIQFAFFGPPTDETNHYKNEQLKQAKQMYDKIREVASRHGENKDLLYIRFMRVCTTPLPQDKKKRQTENKDYDPRLDFCFLPMFGIRKCFDCPASNSACQLFIDHIGRVYQSWDDFLENNKYPKCMIIAPRNGRYSCDYRGAVELVVCPSPACGIGQAVLKGFDIGLSVVGGIAGIVGVGAAFVSVPVLPVIAMGAGIGVGVYGIVRSSITLAQRHKYEESLSLKESEARAAYFTIVAGSLGFTSAGANFALAYMAKNGATISQTTKLIVNGITIANITANGASIGNSAFDVFTQWSDDGTTNTLAVLQLTSSILFFGHAVYTAQSATTIIRNSQSSTISNILDSLSSNRQRKTFLRLLKSTANNMGNIEAGNAQVISYVKKVDNLPEVVRVLTRDTKLMSRNGIKYSVDNGSIVFNDVRIDISEFGNMSKAQRWNTLSTIPEPTNSSNFTNVSKSDVASNMNYMKVALSFIDGVKFVTAVASLSDGKARILEYLLQPFSQYVQRELLLIATKLLAKIGVETDLGVSLANIFGVGQVPIVVCRIIIDFYKSDAANVFKPDGRWKRAMDVAIDALERLIIISTFSIPMLLNELIRYCSKWVLDLLIDREMDHLNVNPKRTRKKLKCTQCNGSYYTSA